MTLILTWLFPDGICMGADSAISYNSSITLPSGRTKKRILTGGIKVLQIPKIKAGISFWGDGNIGSDTTDVWLSDFIYTNKSKYGNIHDFATLLETELRKLVPKLTDPKGSYHYRYGRRGFHLAGFVDDGGKPVPTFYHIHNGESETTSGIDPTKINANYDFPPSVVLNYFSNKIYPHIRNGEFMLYGEMFDNLQKAFARFMAYLKANGITLVFPEPSKFSNSLEAHSEFVRFWIRLTRDVFALSNLPEIIGGEISVLTISPSGDFQFTKKP